MTISYNWLSEYLPEVIEPEKLSKILTSIGLEVESLEKFESIKGSLDGLVIGEVLECQKHPNADKLNITKVNIGAKETLQIVCGASNVAQGQKVVVATVGTTIYPSSGEAITMRIAKIRSIESQGMICAEDEIGLGTNHDGIIVLPNEAIVGTKVKDYFKPYTDFIYEIGLTPNRMDAQSHLGVAKDVCAYLSHHNNKKTRVNYPYKTSFKSDSNSLTLNIKIENENLCSRYAGVSISNVMVQESPIWLKNKLAAIGVRSINNIVDATNFILHETGQPLHAFDANEIANNTILIKTLNSDTPFICLDEKERKLTANDIMICDGNNNPLCIAGVFGGIKSGVKATTKNIFLESACFNATNIRKTSLHHQLRTDAATRFEKGVDVCQTVQVLQRAALLIKDIAGGEISSEIIDVYPNKNEKTIVTLKFQYLKKLSGKNYHPDTLKRILEALEFEIVREGIDELQIAVPYCKSDIYLPADIVEEILRIDGIDNIEIPSSITLTPSVTNNKSKEKLKDKIANFLVGQGFNEILTNSITNSKYFNEQQLETTVKMLNSLTVELNVMRPSLIETGLETIAFNLNRKNNNLQLFEFGKVYNQNNRELQSNETENKISYKEFEHLALFFTGNIFETEWNSKSMPNDFFRAKGVTNAIIELCGLNNISFNLNNTFIEINIGKINIGYIESLNKNKLNSFDIKQAVCVAVINFDTLLTLVNKNKIEYKEVSKFPSVQRDLALVVDRNIQFHQVEEVIKKQKFQKLQNIRLFDVFESDKLGNNKKSMAVNFNFIDDEKTLTDKEIENMMCKLIMSFEKELSAEIRK